MAEFQNTIDLLGDEAVIKALVEKTITEFNDNVITVVGSRVFYSNDTLTSVNLPNVVNVKQYAFNHSRALESVNLPNATNLPSYAFGSCTNLKSVYLPNVTSLDSDCFYKCESLPSIDLPKANGIGRTAFESCTVLKTVILRNNSVCSLSSTNAFKDTPFASGKSGGTLLVPRSLTESYPTATNWSVVIAWNANNRVLALEDYTVDGTITGEIDWNKLNGGAV